MRLSPISNISTSEQPHSFNKRMEATKTDVATLTTDLPKLVSDKTRASGRSSWKRGSEIFREESFDGDRKSGKAQEVVLLSCSFGRDFLRSEDHDAVVLITQVAVPEPGATRRTSRRRSCRFGFERVLQVHGRRASSLVVVVALKAPSGGVGYGPRGCLQPRTLTVMSLHTVASEATPALKSLSHCERSMAAVLLFQSRERGTGNPGDEGAWDMARRHDADHAAG